MQRLVRNLLGFVLRTHSPTNTTNLSPPTNSNATGSAILLCRTNSTVEIHVDRSNTSFLPLVNEHIVSEEERFRYSPESYGFPPRFDAESKDVPFNKQFPANAIIIYTDGSCVGRFATGVGIFLGNQHPLNLSQKLDVDCHNSGLAEIFAANLALHRLLRWDGYSGQFVILRTDYLAIIDAVRYGNNNRFAKYYDNLKSVAVLFPLGVEFQHIKGHNGDPGNEKADELAGQATHWARIGRSNSVNARSRSSAVKPRTRKRFRSVSPNRGASIPRNSSSQMGWVPLDRRSRFDSFNSLSSIDSGYGSDGSLMDHSNQRPHWDRSPKCAPRALIKGGRVWNPNSRPDIIYPHPSPLLPYLK